MVAAGVLPALAKLLGSEEFGPPELLGLDDCPQDFGMQSRRHDIIAHGMHSTHTWYIPTHVLTHARTHTHSCVHTRD